MRKFELSSSLGVKLEETESLKLIDIGINTKIKVIVYRNGHNPTEQIRFDLCRFQGGLWKVCESNKGVEGMLAFSYTDRKSIKKLAEELLTYMYPILIEKGSKDYISVDIFALKGREIRYTMYDK